MSVTFGTVPGPVSRYAFKCGHADGVTDHEFPTHAEAYAVLTAEWKEHGCTGHLAVCGDEFCAAMPVHIHPVEVDPAPQLHVSNLNGRRVLDVLGLDSSGEQPAGSSAAEELLARINGIPASDARRQETGMAYYLPRLTAVATSALERGLEVQWA